MASSKIFFFFVLVSLLNFAVTEAQDDPFYVYQYCSSNRTTTNSSFKLELTTLLSSMSYNTTGKIKFYNTSVTGRDPSDSIYGLFMCRGDFTSQLCKKCVVNATQRLSSEFSLSKQAVIWYEVCMVRYSNRSLFSTVDTRPRVSRFNMANVSNPGSFMPLLFSTMNETAEEAASSRIRDEKFATREVNFSGFQTLYCLAQCTPDLSPQDCRTCLSGVIGDIAGCCEGRLGARVLNPSCNVRYELYPFYDSSHTHFVPFLAPSPEATPAPELVPATNASHADSEFSEDPFYLSYNCSTNKSFTANTTFQLHLTTLLSYLSSNATTTDKKFYKDDVANTAFGLFMCREDLPSRLCGKCVQNATSRISSECG